MPDINVAYRWAIQKCDDPNVRYSMTYRNQQTINGLTYYDCSSFIWYALIAGGFDCVAAHGGESWPFTTNDMRGVLTRLGFTQVSRTGQILPGDIGVHHRGSAGGHTEMCYTGGNGAGVFMGAHGSSLPAQQQVSINTYTTSGTNWDEIYRYQGGAGGVSISLYVIAAMCGNFYQESGINPSVWESLIVRDWDSMYSNHSGGYGLGQWTNTAADSMRLLNLHNWVTSNGYADGDGYGQLAFLLHENAWNAGSVQQSAFTSLEDFLTSDSTDIDMLTKEYFWHWEGINDGTLSVRQSKAREIYNYITQHYGDESINTWVSGNRYLSESERMNNAVLIARYLSSGYIPIYSPGFKIWMAKRHLIQRRRKKL